MTASLGRTSVRLGELAGASLTFVLSREMRSLDSSGRSETNLKLLADTVLKLFAVVFQNRVAKGGCAASVNSLMRVRFSDRETRKAGIFREKL